MTKIFLYTLLFIGLAYVQVSQSHVINGIQERGWWEDQAQALLDKFAQTVKDAINSATKQITDAWNSVENNGNLLEYIKAQFNNIVGTSTVIINNWKEKAQQAGVDVKDCYLSQEQVIKGLPDKALARAQSCIDAEIQEGKNVYDGFEKFISDTIDKVTNLKLNDKLKKCTAAGAWDMLTCFKNLISELTDLISSIPSEIMTRVQSVKTFFAGMQQRLENCAMDQLSGLQSDVTEIADSVVDCIKKKLDATTYLIA